MTAPVQLFQRTQIVLLPMDMFLVVALQWHRRLNLCTHITFLQPTLHLVGTLTPSSKDGAKPRYRGLRLAVATLGFLPTLALGARANMAAQADKQQSEFHICLIGF